MTAPASKDKSEQCRSLEQTHPGIWSLMDRTNIFINGTEDALSGDQDAAQMHGIGFLSADNSYLGPETESPSSEKEDFLHQIRTRDTFMEQIEDGKNKNIA